MISLAVTDFSPPTARGVAREPADRYVPISEQAITHGACRMDSGNGSFWQAGRLKRREKMEAERKSPWGILSVVRPGVRSPGGSAGLFRASGSFPAGADCDDTEDSTYPMRYHTRENLEQLLQLTVTNFSIHTFREFRDTRAHYTRSRLPRLTRFQRQTPALNS